jgi:hypothetical protein
MNFPMMWRFGELEAEVERLEAKRQAYDPEDVARGGAFVILNHDGAVRIERGFIRPADEKPQPWAIRREQIIRQGKMRAGRVQVPLTRKRTTARCLTFSFVTSPRIEPWASGSI